jgi:mono/diheme cytochrome c family protein
MMKNRKRSKLFVFGMLLIIFSWFNIQVTFGQKGVKWEAPPSANQLKNPFKGNTAALAEGKILYMSMCKVCHGETGKGNGEAGLTLSPPPANFLSIDVKDESDGAIFWKLTEGNPPMASYRGLLTEDQRWKLVAFIRNLEEKK